MFNIPNVTAETVESDISAETVKLDETYIPLVEIYSEELKDGTTVDQFPVYTFKYDETPTENDEVLSDQSKPIFTDIFFSKARIFKEPDQQNYIVINENKKLYKNYYIAKTKKNEENKEENTGKKWNDLVSFWLNDPEAKTWFTTPVGAGNEYDNRFTATNEWTPTKYVFGGIYPIMLYKLLHEVRLDTVVEYEKAQQKHDAV